MIEDYVYRCRYVGLYSRVALKDESNETWFRGGFIIMHNLTCEIEF